MQFRKCLTFQQITVKLSIEFTNINHHFASHYNVKCYVRKLNLMFIHSIIHTFNSKTKSKSVVKSWVGKLFELRERALCELRRLQQTTRTTETTKEWQRKVERCKGLIRMDQRREMTYIGCWSHGEKCERIKRGGNGDESKGQESKRMFNSLRCQVTKRAHMIV